MHIDLQIEHDLSVCTVIGEQPQLMRNMLRSLYETADPVAIEVILVDTRGLLGESLAREFSGVQILEALGETPVAARNHAMRLAQGRYIGLFDYDLVVQAGCLKALVDFMDDHPDAGMGGPRTFNAYGRQERTGRSFHSFFSLLAASPVGEGLPECLWKGRRLLEHWNHQNTGEVDCLAGGVHIIRRELLDEAGWLAELPLALAEEDYYLRARRFGWHTFYVHEARITHLNPQRYEKSFGAGAYEALGWFIKRRLCRIKGAAS